MNQMTSGPPFTTLIDAASLAALITVGTATLFDCRFDLADPTSGRAGYRAGHIPGAHYLHLDEDLSAVPDGTNGRHPLPDRTAFAAHLAAVGVARGRQVVAYDTSGGPYAARLWWMMRWLGHAEVAVLDGGLQAWTEAGHALDVGDPGPAVPGDLIAAPPLVGTVSASDIFATRDSGDLLVIDARAPDRFRGEPNPLDPVAGHIPGARSRFYRDNLSPNGRFKPAADLAREWDAVLDDTPPATVALQCGSGVTAAHDLLALEIAGRPGARLYPGSWSEWISDPSRPVARGGA